MGARTEHTLDGSVRNVTHFSELVEVLMFE
jgi:hypothetical protein